MKNFWQSLNKSASPNRGEPVLVLAPMADVTDSAFRRVIAETSKAKEYNPYVTYTEFVSADGLCLAPEKGRQKLMKDLEYTDIERPIVAQFFTSRPEMMEKVASLAVELGFDGVDINMGCPDKSIEKQRAGAALIKNPSLARELIVSAKKGVRDAAKKFNKEEIPVSVKTRLGFNVDELETWLPELLAENPAAIILHLRTRKEMSKVPAHWERMKRVIEIRDSLGSDTLILGNGDVRDISHALELSKETGCNGVMLGRAVFGLPWLFARQEPTDKERLQTLKRHIELFVENLGGVKNFAIMKKHFKSYLSGIEDVSELKEKLMLADTAEEALNLL